MSIIVTLHKVDGMGKSVIRTFKAATTWAFSDADGHKSLLVIEGDDYSGDVLAEFLSDGVESVEDA